MITTPTVLVLGAGASWDYDYPLGGGLVDKMVEYLKPSPPDSFYSKLLRVANRNHFLHDTGTELIERFRVALEGSHRESVDYFLSQRPEFNEVGKLAIAGILAEKEHQVRLTCRRTPHWYQILWQRMFDSHDGWKSFQGNKVSVITYNYDRSFEEFMLCALHYATGKDEAECIEVLRDLLPVAHLHGSLGKHRVHHRAINECRPYCYTNEVAADLVDLLNMTKSIRIIHEVDDCEQIDEFQRAWRYLSEAQNIVFLGFGYAEVNMKRLLHKSVDINPRVPIWGTCMHMNQLQQDHVDSMFDKHGSGLKIKLVNSDITTLLKDHPVLL